MFYLQETLASFAAWTANIIFFSAMLPQLFLNYRLKSTRGLSDLFILACFSSQSAYLGYTFSSGLPFVYKVMNPLCAISIIVLVFQRFYYQNNNRRDKKILLAYFVNILIMFVLIFYAINSYIWAVSFLGWLPVVTGIWKKYPQVLKIYRAKSVEGFSFSFVLITLFAYSFELFAAVILKLPTPMLLNGFRGIAVYLVFLFQFVLYKPSPRLWSTDKNSTKRNVDVYVRSQ